MTRPASSRTPTINLENCVSAGTITQSPSSANHLGVSAVYGGLDGAQATALNFVNVYAIKGCFVEERIYDKKVNGPKVTGTGLFKEKTDLQGMTCMNLFLTLKIKRKSVHKRERKD